jgi:LysR family transcriptional regulator, transcriptional activator of the cysJI operon
VISVFIGQKATCYKVPMANLENFRLVVFRSVATHRSFRKAAESLYLTQPAVSAQIKALEEEVGIQLFERGGGQVTLTAAGAVLLECTNQTREIFARAEANLDGLRGESSGVLTLGASTTIAQYALPRQLRDFRDKNPRVEIHMISGNTEEMVEALLEHRLSLGLIEGPARSKEVRVDPYLEDELLLIVPNGHEWTKRKTIQLSELTQMPLLMRERGSGTRDVVVSALEKSGMSLSSMRTGMEFDSTETIKSAVTAGLGIGFVSHWALIQDRRAKKDFAVVAVEGLQIKRSFLLASLQGQIPQGAAAEFRRFLLPGFAE